MLTPRSSCGIVAVVGLLFMFLVSYPVIGGFPWLDPTSALASPTWTDVASPGDVLIDDPEIREIIARPTLYQQMSRIRFSSDRRTYEFLASHPPLSSQIAKRLYPQLDGYNVTRIEQDVYTIEDRGSLRGEARLIGAADDRHIYRFQGEFRSLANLLHFTGRMVVIFRYREVREGSRIFIDSDPGFYLRIDQLFFHTMTKLLSPVLRSIIDRRVHMIVEASHKLFDQLRTNPDGLYRQMSTWPEVHASDLEAFRQTFFIKTAEAR